MRTTEASMASIAGPPADTYDEAVAEVSRAMSICNACRYCEGYCAVFPAMERRRHFAAADCDFLANLCHGCRGCYYACQYAPPHEFGLNLPAALAELRAASYARHAWPAPLGRLLERNGLAISLLTALAIALVLIATLTSADGATKVHVGPGAFYAVIPYPLMAGLAGAVFLYAVLALALATHRFWVASGGSGAVTDRASSWRRALTDALTLRYLGGGGHGCNDTGEAPSQQRRHLHHLVFYGFMLCFAATSVATFYDHVLGLIAPYAYTSLPVLLGTVGGIGLCAGTAGLLWLKATGDPRPAARRLLGMDTAFLVLLFLTSLTGLLLLAIRETAGMGTALAVHLGFVLALFLALPYSRFLHAPFRFAALLRAARERGPGHGG